jgi:hypothetical protein
MFQRVKSDPNAETTWDTLQLKHRTFLKYDLPSISDLSIVTVGTGERRSHRELSFTVAIAIPRSVQETSKMEREHQHENILRRGFNALWRHVAKDAPPERLKSVKKQLGNLLPRVLGIPSSVHPRIMYDETQ